MHRVEVGLARGASPAWLSSFVPHPHSAWAARLAGQSHLARSPSGLPLSSALPIACLIPGVLA